MSIYLSLPGSAGNYASSPDSAAFSISGDIDIRADVTYDMWTSTPGAACVSKWESLAGENRDWIFIVDSTGKLHAIWSNDGVYHAALDQLSTVAVPFANGARGSIRYTLDVDNGAGGWTLKFYTGNSITGPWTQLGADVTGAGTTSIFNGTSKLEVGTWDTGVTTTAASRFKAYRVQVRNNILDDGTGIQFDANFSAQPGNVTTFTESSSNAATVTMNGTAKLASDVISNNYQFVSAGNGVSVTEKVR